MDLRNILRLILERHHFVRTFRVFCDLDQTEICRAIVGKQVTIKMSAMTTSPRSRNSMLGDNVRVQALWAARESQKKTRLFRSGFLKGYKLTYCSRLNTACGCALAWAKIDVAACCKICALVRLAVSAA